MTTRLLTSLTLVAGFLMMGSPALAHHGTGISYDLTTLPITVEATVTEFHWTNPHLGIFVDIENDEGNVENWSIEGSSPGRMTRAGWNRFTIKPGDEVTITFYRSLIQAARAGVIAKIILDGQEVLRFQRDEPRTAGGVR